MTKAKSPHNADDSFIGYVYQGQYALLLLQAAAPDTSVSVETDEDVVLEGATPTLIQLKHSSAARPTALTVKNVGWWKTLAIWVKHPRRAAASFLFITCAPIQSNSPLEVLRPRAAAPLPDFGPLADSLLEEAERVKREREAAKAADPDKPLPHSDKAPGCEAVLTAGRADLLELLAQVTIVDGAVTAAGVELEVAQRLRGVLPPKYCEPVVKRLMEWWDRRVTLALLGQRARDIQHEEYAEKLWALIQEHSDDQLPDDYSSRQPSDEELAGELRTVMERQIDLVDGGQGRLRRAARERWRARHQRNRWLEDDISLGPVLEEYDARLLEAWNDQHGPMIDDTSGQDSTAKKQGGQRILDWAHDAAPDKVVPPKPTWRHPFLARGQLQELAEDRQVGWHPEFLVELEKLDGEGES